MLLYFIPTNIVEYPSWIASRKSREIFLNKLNIAVDRDHIQERPSTPVTLGLTLVVQVGDKLSAFSVSYNYESERDHRLLSPRHMPFHLQLVL